MKINLLFLLILVSLSTESQTAKFTYQYHNETAKGGKFILYDKEGKTIFEADASAGYLGAANNPYYQLTKNTGPLPNGTWEIYAIKVDSLSILRLRPTDDVVMPKDSTGKPYRDGFLIHGIKPGKTSSQSSAGCIILGPANRAILKDTFKKDGVIKLTVINILTGNDVN